ncbi:MAG: VCBS repeat-containing protein [Candidatus Eisenbacteria bacterium]|nr:VCBS repeat-containing protein [Candidatus Latescibacterota bacterium]MBD3302395.1 VCBS repeat-containing protein [Candidatus Eisenbacteria bacterium]
MGRRAVGIVTSLIVVVAIGGILLIREADRTGRTVGEFLTGRPPASAEDPSVEPAAPRGIPDEPVSRFAARPIGREKSVGDRPMIAHVRIADLDRDGAADVLVCDVAAAQVFWLRQEAPGRFVERAISDSIGAPVHVEAADLDADGDLDVLIASMGLMLPNNDPIGSVIALENLGGTSFRQRVLVEGVARVTDVRAGDLDGDGDLDLVAGQFGYDQGEIRWMENRGGWRYESHRLLNLSGTIHTPITDADGDGDLDIFALVSQEWEEIYLFVNDGAGSFERRIIYGAATDDYCSSGIAVDDLDGDGDPDVLYTNGDAFVATDYRPLPNHGVQWLENLGGGEFAFHRIADLPGAYGPCIADVDGDGDPDGICGSCFNHWDRPEARSVVWFENAGESGMLPHAVASRPTHLVTMDAGDLNGDGRVDLVTGGMALYPPFDSIERITAWIQTAPDEAGAPGR